MANWKQTLDVRDLWNGTKAETLTAAQLCSELADRIEKNVSGDIILDRIIQDFRDLAQDESTDLNDFDDVLEYLYNWADMGHRLWIRT